jgi:Ca-activated chloride channel family protein
VLERDANIVGQSVTTTLNQLYGRQMKYVVLEMELPPGRAGEEMRVASVDVSYANMATKTTDRLGSAVSVRFTDLPSLVESNANPDVMVAAAHQISVERNRIAVQLRDEGKVEEARQTLESNAAYLFDNATKYNSPVLQDYGTSNFEATERLDEASWKKQRKVMKEEQHAIKTQQKSR